MNRTIALSAAVALGVLGCATGRAQAQTPGLNIIEYRQVGMALTGGDFAGIRDSAAAKVDVKTLEGRAKAIQRWAALIPAVFPAGTAAGNTKALPEVWSDNAGYVKAAAAMGEAAGKLADAAKAGDFEAVNAQIKAVADTCAACHRTYRAR
jgi:cytochrome c556